MTRSTPICSDTRGGKRDEARLVPPAQKYTAGVSCDNGGAAYRCSVLADTRRAYIFYRDLGAVLADAQKLARQHRHSDGDIRNSCFCACVRYHPYGRALQIGMDDAVYYECDNEEFEKFVTDHGFKTEWGSYSDIAVLAPVWKVAAVNVSVGYQEEHSQVERLFVDALFDTIDKVQHMLHDSANIEPFKYVERSWNYASGYYSGWYDDGYSLHKGWFTPLEEGEVRCQFCGEPDKKENYLPLHWHSAADKDMMFHVCNECYAHSVAEIEWCSKCGTGYFLGQNDVKNMPKDRTTWVCKHCKTEEKTNDTVGQEHSGAVQSSNSALSGNSKPADRRAL